MIYLDYAAATPLWPKVRRTLNAALKTYGNPGSLHSLGQTAKADLALAKQTLARLLSAHSHELVLTASATESANMAVFGVVEHFRTQGPIHIITSTIEHPAVYEPIRRYEHEGVEVTYLPVDSTGRIRPEVLKAAIRPNTRFISIMAANNEIGAIQPIRALVRVTHAAAKELGHHIVFHSDASQYAAWNRVNVEQLGIDLLTLSGPKLGGPASGLLYIRTGTVLEPLLLGGGQQQHRRSGTEDPVSAAGFACAAQETQAAHTRRGDAVRALRDELSAKLHAAFPEGICNHLSDRNGLPNIVSFTLEGIDAEATVYALDAVGIAISAGSACSSAHPDYRVLQALGRTVDQAKATLRMSLGWTSSQTEVRRAGIQLIRVLKQQREERAQLRTLETRGAQLATDYAKRYTERE